MLERTTGNSSGTSFHNQLVRAAKPFVIGVISKPNQAPAVAEFFELFKTPWEFYRPGRRYDVLISTSDDLPSAEARLRLVCNSEAVALDAREGLVLRSQAAGGSVHYLNAVLPIYGHLAAFATACHRADSCLASSAGVAGIRVAAAAGPLIRLGYDLFAEIGKLISEGQPVSHAGVPTLDLHIRMLRNFILDEGIPLVEIPPIPAGRSFVVCLTHDIDFVGIRNHKFDHTMWGFLYRATIGNFRNLLCRRVSARRLLESWRAAASLLFVYLGWAKDFWEPFPWYLEVEKNLPATYFLIPFKRRAGDYVPGQNASRRAAAYDVSDIPHWARTLQEAGCELGVHGIDAWHSFEKGRAELGRIASVTRGFAPGIRMHWLLRNPDTPAILEQSGYTYDSTAGYNETIGYRNGTAQVFRPFGAKTLLELPLHIQDGALFYPQRLDLTEAEARERCQALIDNVRASGGALTLLWHDRSHGPERFWGGFYRGIVGSLRASDAWFATGAQAVNWFRSRREVRFERAAAGGVRCSRRKDTSEELPPLRMRIYRPAAESGFSPALGQPMHSFVDVPWVSPGALAFDDCLNNVPDASALLSQIEHPIL